MFIVDQIFINYFICITSNFHTNFVGYFEITYTSH